MNEKIINLSKNGGSIQSIQVNYKDQRIILVTTAKEGVIGNIIDPVVDKVLGIAGYSEHNGTIEFGCLTRIVSMEQILRDLVETLATQDHPQLTHTNEIEIYKGFDLTQEKCEAPPSIYWHRHS